MESNKYKKPVFAVGGTLVAIYVGYLIFATGSAVSTQSNTVATNVCANAWMDWKSMESMGRQPEANNSFMAKEYAKVKLACVNGPKREVRDYTSTPEIVKLSADPAIIEKARLELEAAAAKR